MQYPRPFLLIAALLVACGQPAPNIDFVPVNAVIPDLQEIAIDEFENRGIDYRITADGILEADYARVEDISEIVIRIWEIHLPRDRSFSINPDYLAAFRAQLDEESIRYRALRADGSEWTVVEEGDAVKAREILGSILGVGPEAWLLDELPPE